MPSYAVDMAFGSKDKVSKAFGRMDRAAGKFGRTADRAFSKASRKAAGFQSITKGILAAGVIQRGFAGLARGIGAVTTQFVDFDQATIGAAARFKDIGPDAADFEYQLSRIRDRAREAGQATEFTAAQSASALDFLARAGFTSAEAFGSLTSMINLATASGEDFATVADYSSDLLGAFGMNVENTSQKIANLTRLNDVLVKAANSANVTIEDMFETMKIAGPIATAMGQSLEDVTAITAFLGGSGIKGSQAATALKNSILNLAAPSTKAAGMLKSLGVEVADSQGNMRKLDDIIGDLAPQLNKMGNVKAGAILNEIFGKRAIAGAINIGKGTQAIIKLKKAFNEASGTAQKTADRMRKSIGNRMITLGSAASEMGFKIMEAFEVRGEGAIDRMTKAIRAFDPSPIINTLEFTIELFKNIIAVLRPFKEMIGVLIAGWMAYAAVMKIVAAAQLIVAFTNPVTAIIASLALLGAFVYNFWDEIALGWSIMWEGMKTTFFKLVTIFSFIWGGFFKLIANGIRLWSTFLGLDVSDIDSALSDFEKFKAEVAVKGGITPEAPNKELAEARQDIRFSGRLDIAGAPEGSTVTGQTTGAPDIEMDMLGGA